jgi:hypothetical protein
MYSSEAFVPSPETGLGLTRDETAALQRIAGDLGISSLTDLVTLLLRDIAAAELNPEGWEHEAVTEWLQFRLTSS